MMIFVISQSNVLTVLTVGTGLGSTICSPLIEITFGGRGSA